MRRILTLLLLLASAPVLAGGSSNPPGRDNLGLGTADTPTFTGILLSGGALNGTQAATGSPSSTTDAYGYPLNSLKISSDNMDVTGLPAGKQVAFGTAIEHQIGGTALGGQFVSLFSVADLSTSPSASYDGNIVGSWSWARAGAVTTGSNKVALTGANPQVSNAATGPLRALQGVEIDVSNTGTANQVVGLDITKTSSDTTQGINNDRAIEISTDAAATTWKTGIDFGTYNGKFGIATTGSLMTTSAGTITNGIDLSLLTIAGKAFMWGSSFLKGDGSLNVSVAGTGVATLASSGANANNIVLDNAAGGQAVSLVFSDATTQKWLINKGAGNGFTITDSANSKTALAISTAGVIALGETAVTGNTLVGGAGGWAIPSATTGTNTNFGCFAAGNVFTIQSSACTISSMRFKNLIGPYKAGGALETVERLEPIVFTMKQSDPPNPDINYTLPQIGLSAENVAEVAPRCAVYENDGVTPKSYRQECLIAVLVAAVQSQQREIEALKAR